MSTRVIHASIIYVCISLTFFNFRFQPLVFDEYFSFEVIGGWQRPAWFKLERNRKSWIKEGLCFSILLPSPGAGEAWEWCNPTPTRWQAAQPSVFTPQPKLTHSFSFPLDQCCKLEIHIVSRGVQSCSNLPSGAGVWPRMCGGGVPAPLRALHLLSIW